MADDGLTSAPRDEVELLAALRRGEDAAFEQLVRNHAGRMLAVARRFLTSEEDAQDAVQEAFLSAFRAVDRFEGQSRIATWLHRIVVNAALMKLRSRKAWQGEGAIEGLLPRFQDDGHQESPAVCWGETADVQAERRETRDLVRQSITRLPAGYREVLVLRDIEERDTQETAELLGITPNAVKTRLHRARQALRTLLDAAMRGETP